jgi:hypothetical protein
VTKYIEVDNYRFEPDTAKVFQSGVWERFIAATRENNNHVRRLLGELLENPKLKLAYNITLGERGQTQETMLVRVEGTQSVIFKAELKQGTDSTPALAPHLMRASHLGELSVQSMWNESSATRQKWREAQYRDFQGKAVCSFDKIQLLLEKALTRMAPTMLGYADERGNALCLKLRTKNVSDHEIVMTLYRH